MPFLQLTLPIGSADPAPFEDALLAWEMNGEPLPHAHGGGISGAGKGNGSTARPHRSRQLALHSEPCTSRTRVEPARWCKPSMFWVTTVTSSNSVSSSAIARCPAFGSTDCIFCRRIS